MCNAKTLTSRTDESRQKADIKDYSGIQHCCRKEKNGLKTVREKMVTVYSGQSSTVRQHYYCWATLFSF